jgi:hypothetical protein
MSKMVFVGKGGVGKGKLVHGAISYSIKRCESCGFSWQDSNWVDNFF